MVDLIGTQNVQEIFFDGVDNVKAIDGVVRFSIFVQQNGSGVVAGRLAIPIDGLPDMIQALVLCLTEAANRPRQVS